MKHLKQIFTITIFSLFTGGEHVHADYYGTFTQDGKADNFRVMKEAEETSE